MSLRWHSTGRKGGFISPRGLFLTFLGNYQSFFWPLVMIKDDHLRALPIGMLAFQTSYGQQTKYLMAATVMCVVPLIVIFVLLPKRLVAGIQLGAVQG